ncbi:MAG: InlB B-repeat-containing protein [Tannerella sp.]|jgi:hypothetical protein|nr:InlB B-repeat-containing protein [Tannerella sp.]
MPSHDVTVTAVFDCSTYSVSFNGNGGNNIPGTVSNVSMGSTFNIPTVIPTKDSSTFLGWKDKNGSPVFSGYKNPGDTFTMPQRNVTLDASWATIYWKSTAINAIVPLINSDTLEILGTNNLAGTVYSNLDGGGKGWTAVSNNSWITITNNGSGTMDNNGNIAADIWSCDIKLDPNTTTSSRTGSVTFTQKDSGLVFVQSFEQEGQNNQVFVVFQSKDPGSMYDGFAIHSVTVPLNDPGSTPSILPGASYKATVDSSVITSSTFGFGRMWEVAVGGQNENVHV